jgi:hypothetical protein
MSQEHRVVDAYILGENSSTSLPLETIDELAVLPMLQQIRQEWRQLLASNTESGQPQEIQITDGPGGRVQGENLVK